MIADIHLDPSYPNPSSSGSATPSDDFYKKKEKNSKVLKTISSPASDESDGYPDPESLIPEYLSLQSRVYRQQPGLFEQGKKQRKKAPGKSPMEESSPEVAKLRRKIAKIEADVLFDQVEAEEAWRGRLDELRMEVAEEREQRVAQKTSKVQKPNEALQGESELPLKGKDPEPVTNLNSSDENEETGLFGDIFSPEQGPLFTEPAQNTESSDSVNTLRDFGKWSGLSPRRVLEETCRARFVVSPPPIFFMFRRLVFG